METVTIKFTREEFNLAIEGLLELPARKSMDFILKLDKEAKEQITKAGKVDADSIKAKKE